MRGFHPSTPGYHLQGWPWGILGYDLQAGQKWISVLKCGNLVNQMVLIIVDPEPKRWKEMEHDFTLQLFEGQYLVLNQPRNKTQG